MSLDYGEIFCSAVDEIITSKLQDLQYDITKLCTIVDDTYSNQGKYTVSDGTAKYDAFSTDISFKKGNSVLVTVPNGDYSMQKTIVGRVAATNTTPFNYTSPMDTMIKITNDVLDSSKTIYGDNAGLLANDSNKSTIIGPLYSISETGDFAGFTRLGITANFRSWLNGLDVAQGTYGIKILIYTDISDAPGSVKENAVYELTFSSADMIGNPYQFESYFYQEKVFDISNINNIKQIDVYFYQNGQFYDGNGNYIPWQDEDINNSIGLEPSKKPNNLFVNDVKIYLGYETGAFTDETLILYTSDPLTYHYKNNNLQKNVALRWIHMIDEKNFSLLNGKNLDEKFEVHWFKYNPGNEIIDQYAGKDWEEVFPDKNDLFLYSFTPDIKKQTEQIKVIGLINEITGSKTVIDENGNETVEDIYSLVPYYSNLLIFENEEKVPDEKTWDASTALSIICLDNSEGNYYIYNQNGKINNEGIGRGYKRYLKAMYQGAEITSSIGTLDWIKWYFPRESTMLIETDTFYNENNGVKTDEIVSYKGVDYDFITRKAIKNNAGKFELPSTQQAYSIDNQWSFQNSNNTVRCQVSIDGVIYEAIEELRFGKGGTNGTEITFLIEFTNNDNALIAEDGSQVTVRARLYDSSGERVGFTPEMANKIKWSWYKENKKNNYITLPQKKEGDSIILTYNRVTDNGIPLDNYFILQATYNNLTAYLPIPIKTKNTSFIEGAREVIYNHQGIPNYYNDAYVLYYWDDIDKKYKENTNGTWKLEYDEKVEVATKENALSKGYIPVLKNLDSRPGYVALSASPFYASGYNDKVCVSYISDDKTYGWSQPILIMQSKYDFAMLNQWDGSLTLDEENGTILSTMLGAGRKNEDNTFSGVLIGDIQGGSNLNDTETLTGVYGLHEGTISYALKEDGTATFGKLGKGQILIDGNESIIQSGNFSTSNQGTLIDLDDGIIDIKWPGNKFDSSGNNLNGRIRLQPTSPYLYINSTNNTPLIQIGSDSSYLKSDNSTATNGTKLDLGNGTLDIRSEKSQFLVSGSGSPYFKMAVPQNENDKAYANSLFLLDNNNYYLKSKNYLENEYIKIGGYNTYKQPNNPIVNISNIVAISPDGKVWKTDGKNLISIYEFSSKGGTIGSGDNSISYSQTSEQVKQSYISQLIPNLKTAITEKGFKLDLNNSVINGYDLYLKGTNATTKKSFILDSSAPDIPFRINNDKFNVSWDGVLTCTKVNSLSNDGTTDKAISINENFYVTKGGGAGGSGCNFGGNFRGGFSGIGTGTFKGKGMFDELYVGGEQYKKETINFISTVGLVRDGKNIKLNYFQHSMNVLCNSFTRNPMKNTYVSIDHTHNIGNTPSQAKTGTTLKHYHYHIQRNAYTDGIK